MEELSELEELELNAQQIAWDIRDLEAELEEINSKITKLGGEPIKK